MFWPGIGVCVVGSYVSRGWDFPDVLRDRQLECTAVGIKAWIGTVILLSDKNILNPPDNTSVHTIGASLHHRVAVILETTTYLNSNNQ